MNKINLEELNEFWFTDEVIAKWFIKDDSFDSFLRSKYLDLYIEYLNKFLCDDNFYAYLSVKQLIALVILFDQMPRNIFRDKPQSFATDYIALAITKKLIEKKYDVDLNKTIRQLIYMPFMHSENLTDQNKCIELMRNSENFEAEKFAIQHKDTIERFSRFPHRNEILNRISTQQELDFLKQPNSSF